MESLSPPVSDEPEEPAASSPPEGPMTAINRALLTVRHCMVLRVWEVSAVRDFQMMSQIENLGRAVSLMEAARMVPPGLSARVLEACTAADVELARRQVVLWAKEEMLAYILPLAGEMRRVQEGLLINSVHDAACLLFEFALLTRLSNVMRANAALNDPTRNRRLVRPKFVGADGAVLKVADDYRKGDPDVVLAEALVKKKELAEQIAWARRRKLLASKGLIPNGGKPAHAAFSRAAFNSLVAKWGAKLDIVERIAGESVLPDSPGSS